MTALEELVREWQEARKDLLQAFRAWRDEREAREPGSIQGVVSSPAEAKYDRAMIRFSEKEHRLGAYVLPTMATVLEAPKDWDQRWQGTKVLGALPNGEDD